MRLRYFFMALMLGAQASFAEPGRSDYDINNNGLIEINDLADLNEIRRNLSGKSLYGSSAGCPASGCVGFELTQDLDFDTNADGQMDAKDAYWNSGLGWQPLGDVKNSFTAVFDGQGHSINNLYIQQLNDDKVYVLGLENPATITDDFYQGGLFFGLKDAQVSRLVMEGPLTHVSVPTGWAGLLAGHAINTRFDEIAVQGRVNGMVVGGLVAFSNHCQFKAIALALKPEGDAEGINLLSGITFKETQQAVLNLISWPDNGATANAAHLNNPAWSLALAVSDADGLHTPKSYFDTQYLNVPGGSFITAGFTRAELSCPTTANDTVCSELPLYTGWEQAVDAQGKPYWDFGNAQQLPGLRLFGRVFRDNDNDSIWDDRDAFPQFWAANRDADKDGAPDEFVESCDEACLIDAGLVIDAFPANPAASIDQDEDGLPDRWNPGCDVRCQQSSGLTLDARLNDTNNNGIPDAWDTDDNGDGKLDADSNSNGLVEIYTLEQLYNVRFSPAGIGRTHKEDGIVDSSGCPKVFVSGRYRAQCHGYELTQDLDFDTNHNGRADEGDAFWDEGMGWAPSYLTGEFDGHGFAILNLMINRPQEVVGLFSVVVGSSDTDTAYIHRLVLRGPQTTVIGAGGGLLSGKAQYARFEEIAVSGSMTGTANQVTGGLVGEATYTTIHAVAAAVRVKGPMFYTAALAWRSSQPAIPSTSFVTGSITAIEDEAPRTLDRFRVGSMKNSFSSVAELTTNLFVTAATTDNSVFVQPIAPKEPNPAGFTLAQMQCPKAASDTTCAGRSLYTGWENSLDAEGKPYWVFGNGQQLPGLRLFGKLFRDSDGDGSFDEDDIAPLNSAYSLDTDKDGAPDAWSAGCNTLCQAASGFGADLFPNNPAAWADADLDGLPDSWSANCDTACQKASSLTLDRHPNDADNDGTADIKDNDDNQDTRIDIDANSNGLVEIHSLAELNAVRFALAGEGQRLSADSPLDVSGCPARLVAGVYQRRCWGYELVNDLDFDTNRDGVMNAQDIYWNGGAGWQPLQGDREKPFHAVFDGHGFSIANLWINNPQVSRVGLFGNVYGSTIKNLALNGPLTKVVGYSFMGILAGEIEDTELTELAISGKVEGIYFVGGLAGSLTRSHLKGGFVEVQLIGANTDSGYQTGAIAGAAGETTLENVFAAGRMVAARNVGGLLGASTNNRIYHSLSVIAFKKSFPGAFFQGLAGNAQIEYSYHLNDPLLTVSTQGFDLNQLQCPTAANNTACAGKALYTNWDKDLNSAGQPVWDFGTSKQLPGLRLMGRLYRSNGSLTNQAPRVSLRFSQKTLVGKEVFLDKGDITFEASIDEANASDPHQLSWSLDGKVIATGTATQLVRNPASLGLGKHTLSVEVKNTGNPPLTGKSELVFEVKEKETAAGALNWPWLLVFLPLLRGRRRNT